MSYFDTGETVYEPEPQRNQTRQGTLYIRLPSENDPNFRKVKAIVNMFPGQSQAVIYFADTKQRRGATCALDDRMIRELEDLLGKVNIVVK